MKIHPHQPTVRARGAFFLELRAAAQARAAAELGLLRARLSSEIAKAFKATERLRR